MTKDANAPVGNEREYSKEPFKDNVARSIPPAVPGSIGRNEGDTNHAHGGRGRDSFAVAKRQFDMDKTSRERSPWCR